MQHSRKTIGIAAGIAAAVCYGTNPLGALKLYAEGMNTNSVLFFRFGLAWVIMAVAMALRRESLRSSRRELLTLTALGLLFIASSLTLYLSFHYMAAGVASTLLFVYPVLTAAIMCAVFHERLTWHTVLSIVLALTGVILLYGSDGAGRLSAVGVVLVLVSALTYALYIIIMDRARLPMSPFKINFYVLFYCAVGMLVYGLLAHQPLLLPSTPTAWFYVGWLAVVPAIMALCLMVYAAQYVGSTTTAILGALEPLTAVLIGIGVFHEAFTLQLGIGMVLILGSVIIIALRK